MRWTDDDRYGAPSKHDRFWGVVTVFLGAVGMAVLLCGQDWMYRLAFWIGGLR